MTWSVCNIVAINKNKDSLEEKKSDMFDVEHPMNSSFCFFTEGAQYQILCLFPIHPIINMKISASSTVSFLFWMSDQRSSTNWYFFLWINVSFVFLLLGLHVLMMSSMSIETVSLCRNVTSRHILDNSCSHNNANSTATKLQSNFNKQFSHSYNVMYNYDLMWNQYHNNITILLKRWNPSPVFQSSVKQSLSSTFTFKSRTD